MRTILLILLASVSFAQNDFKWDIIDSVAKSKDQIYKDTRRYIADKWQSSKDLIQNDDKDNGEVLIKATKTKVMKTLFDVYAYEFMYTMVFRMKDNKFKISVYDVYCASAKNGASEDIIKINPSNKESYKTPMGVPSEDKVIKMMNDLQNDINSICLDYISYIKNTKETKTDW